MKSLAGISSDATCTKLGMLDLYASAWGGVSNSDIKLPAHLGHFLFALYIRNYVLSFGYAILGFSSSHCQHISINLVDEIYVISM